MTLRQLNVSSKLHLHLFVKLKRYNCYEIVHAIISYDAIVNDELVKVVSSACVCRLIQIFLKSERHKVLIDVSFSGFVIFECFTCQIHYTMFICLSREKLAQLACCTNIM